MTYRDKFNDKTAAVEQARENVGKAMESGNVNAINKANRALADAHDEYQEWFGGRVHDPR